MLTEQPSRLEAQTEDAANDSDEEFRIMDERIAN